jgi:hypothetical protein
VADRATLLAVTRRVVDRFTEEGYLFTALDVSNAVKQSLTDVRHREVSPVVRQLYDDGDLGEDYTRSMINVMAGGNKPAQAYLYLLDGDDPDDYDDSRRKQQALPPVSASPSSVAIDDDDGDELTLLPGKDGRLRISRAFLERAGVDEDEVALRYLGAGPGLVLAPHDPYDPPGLAVLNYSHPDFLHVPRSFTEAFDPNRPITARVSAHDDVVEVVGSARL